MNIIIFVLWLLTEIFNSGSKELWRFIDQYGANVPPMDKYCFTKFLLDNVDQFIKVLEYEKIYIDKRGYVIEKNGYVIEKNGYKNSINNLKKLLQGYLNWWYNDIYKKLNAIIKEKETKCRRVFQTSHIKKERYTIMLDNVVGEFLMLYDFNDLWFFLSSNVITMSNSPSGSTLYMGINQNLNTKGELIDAVIRFARKSFR